MEVVSSLPTDRVGYYGACRCARVDPGPRIAARSTQPAHLAFGEAEKHFEPGDGARRMFRALRQLAVQGSFLVPLRGRETQPICVLTFITDRKATGFGDWLQTSSGVLHLAAQALHARIEQLIGTGDEPYLRMVPRERECLERLAQWLRVDRIAEHIAISTRTVQFLLACARRRPGTTTREQALAKALLNGPISP